MKTLRFLTLVATFLPLLHAAEENPAARRPNIVWIFSDDHATQAIGAYGGRLQGLNPTPNIDRLAAEGMRFDRSYVENSICSPSRAALLTGKLSHKHRAFLPVARDSTGTNSSFRS